MRAGSGNGNPRRRNAVDTTYPLYRQHRSELEAKYSWLREEKFFGLLEALMLILEVENSSARRCGNSITWFMEMPEASKPRLVFYFTYSDGLIVMRDVLDP
jgi:hypothetical protein